ncbi:hypothetical protein AMTRI_Chr04g252140 [Amborella trichopoda]
MLRLKHNMGDILAFNMETEEWMMEWVTINQNRHGDILARYNARITTLHQDGAVSIAHLNQGLKAEASVLTQEKKWVEAHHIADMCDKVRNHGYPQFLVGEVLFFTRNDETIACDKNGKLSVLVRSQCYNFVHYKPTLYSWEFGESRPQLVEKRL